VDEQILDEMQSSLGANRPDISQEKLGNVRRLMISAVRDGLVEDYEPLIEGLKLSDPDDRHVLAAAIKVGAQVIVTSNLKDFPAEDLIQWDVEAKSPDDFVLDSRIVWACVQQIADSRNNPPESIEDVLSALEATGLVEAVAALRAG
jgi:predicted nucleic acid-binding protein